MDLALLTSQRSADVLKLKHADIRDGALWIVQNKISAHLGIEITGELAATIPGSTPDHNIKLRARLVRPVSQNLFENLNNRGFVLTHYHLKCYSHLSLLLRIAAYGGLELRQWLGHPERRRHSAA